MIDFLDYWHFCLVHDWEEHLFTLAIGWISGALTVGLAALYFML